MHCKGPYGDYHVYDGYQYQTPTQLADINTRRLIPMCQNSEKWRDIAYKEFKKSIDLGAREYYMTKCSIMGEQNIAGIRLMDIMFLSLHLAVMLPLAKGFRSISDKTKPDFMYAGELVMTLKMHSTVSLISGFDPFDHTAIKRYIDPQGLIMAAVVGFNHRVMRMHVSNTVTL